MVMKDAKTVAIQAFVHWSSEHITGDEKGEAQIFLDRMFQAFGWAGLKEAGATCEMRVKNNNGGTSFADLVWKPRVVIEMKKRGTDLSKHYSQAFTYWSRLVPNRPRYAVLCNFDEFWIYDFETQLDTPVEKLQLKNIPISYGALTFMFEEVQAPIFGNHQEEVTRGAANKLAECFNSMTKRGVADELAQRFVLQMMMALFAEDIGLLEKLFVTKILRECKTPKDSYDLIGGLFESMNAKSPAAGGRFQGVPYFNGGLFAEPARVELDKSEIDLLIDAADFNWSNVRPEIFGTLFEHSLGVEKRHAYGAHFTAPVDIMKIVGPTIVAPWSKEIESANTLGRLRQLLARIEAFKVLDPACGSGNFLYVAYREMKRLEARIYERISAEYKSVDPTQRPFGFVSTRNFYGMDINPFAVDIAKVTMMLAHKLSIDELHIVENALPLDNLDGNFIAGDALINPDGTQSNWPESDVVVGNPPFLGAKKYKREYPASYVNLVRKAYPKVPGMADLCVFWIRRTHDHLRPCSSQDPLAGRAGLVGTQNIRSNASRKGGLDYVVTTGTIVDAVQNQPWSGEAAVNVSIVNWVKTKDSQLLPDKKILWFAAPEPKIVTLIEPKKKIKGPAIKRYSLDYRIVPEINSSLSDQTDLSKAKTIQANRKPQRVFQGFTPGYKGFVLSQAERDLLIGKEPESEALIRPYLIGKELNAKGQATRFIIDAHGFDVGDLSAHPLVLSHLKNLVLPAVQFSLAAEQIKDSDMVKSRQEHLNRWWTFWAQRTELRAWLEDKSRIVAASRTQSSPFIFHFVKSNQALGDKLQLFAFEDDYSFGIIQSSAHCAWYANKGARLKNEIDYNYSSENVFGTFPWPQFPMKNQVDAVAAAGREIRKLRLASVATGKGMRKLYGTLSLPGKTKLGDAHAALNEAVLACYGFSSKSDLCAQLLALNAGVAAIEEAGGFVTGPGVPSSYLSPAELVSEDVLGP